MVELILRNRYQIWNTLACDWRIFVGINFALLFAESFLKLCTAKIRDRSELRIQDINVSLFWLHQNTRKIVYLIRLEEF